MNEKEKAAVAANPQFQYKGNQKDAIPQQKEDMPIDIFLGTHDGAGDPIQEIVKEMKEGTEGRPIGMFRIKTANQAVKDAAEKPDPKPLFDSLWYEGEVCCLFSDSNLGKSILAVQMADAIAKTHSVLYVDFELSEKQFQLRYTDENSGVRHVFPDYFRRAEIEPDAILYEGNFEDAVLDNIEKDAINVGAKVLIIDNLTYLCNQTEKGDQAGQIMMKLIRLKQKYGWSLLIIAHTPKRPLSNPITSNDLAGSKKLYNFFDSVFAIGQSSKDPGLRYLKQVKVRASEFRYDKDNVMVFRVEKSNGWLHFEFVGYDTEKNNLREMTDEDRGQEDANVMELYREGKSLRDIADTLGISKSKAGYIINRNPDASTMSKQRTGGTERT